MRHDVPAYAGFSLFYRRASSSSLLAGFRANNFSRCSMQPGTYFAVLRACRRYNTVTYMPYTAYGERGSSSRSGAAQFGAAVLHTGELKSRQLRAVTSRAYGLYSRECFLFRCTNFSTQRKLIGSLISDIYRWGKNLRRRKEEFVLPIIIA